MSLIDALTSGPRSAPRVGVIDAWVASLVVEERVSFAAALHDSAWSTMGLYRLLSKQGMPCAYATFDRYRREKRDI